MLNKIPYGLHVLLFTIDCCEEQFKLLGHQYWLVQGESVVGVITCLVQSMCLFFKRPRWNLVPEGRPDFHCYMGGLLVSRIENTSIENIFARSLISA